MSESVFRGAAYTLLNDFAVVQDVPIFFENGPEPDLDAVANTWLDVELSFGEASSVTLGARPRGRQTGFLIVRVFARQGTGTLDQDVLTEALVELLRPQHLGGATLEFPKRLAGVALKGWSKAGLMVPFRLDKA